MLHTSTHVRVSDMISLVEWMACMVDAKYYTWGLEKVLVYLLVLDLQGVFVVFIINIGIIVARINLDGNFKTSTL